MIDDLGMPPLTKTRLDSIPGLVCIPCGRALFGPMTVPCFHVFQNAECEICATPTTVVHGSAFRDYVRMFSER